MVCAMLVISRSIGDSFRIGDDIVIKVVDNTGSTAKFGITAPKNIAIHRDEIYNKIHDDTSNPVSPYAD